MSKRKRREVPRFLTPIIETHCHLDYLDSDALSETLEKAEAAGVERIITIAVSPSNLELVLKLTRTHSQVWGTQGVHPHEAETYSPAVEHKVREQAQDSRILAIGEIGLDYYYDHADRQIQQSVFERQLQVAADLDMPVVIHTREADDDTRDILRNFAPLLKRKGVIHSFTSGLALAEYCLAEGFTLGFNGIVTFNKAENVREVVRATPVERILLETDSPYLTPVPYRGKPNAPFYLPLVAEKIAELKDMDIEPLLEQVHHNSVLQFFGSK
ncbi:MAG: TatD family hydrolase [Pseudomonadota bacterium]